MVGWYIEPTHDFDFLAFSQRMIVCNETSTSAPFLPNQSFVAALGPFKYYVIKEVGEWGQKMAIFDDLQYCTSSKRWVGGVRKK